MIEINNLSKIFETKDGNVQALKDINITINDGDIYGIIGMSGAGKSTLVRCINLIETPSSGSIVIDGTDLTTLSAKELRIFRRSIAMIFQSFNLLMQRTCLQNICFPLTLSGMKRKDAISRAKELLKLVGLPDKAGAYPAQLSGGQMQRIAIARALATRPKVLLCDEATSALDPKTTGQILDLIKDINKKLGITAVIITHQMSVVQKICNRVSILDQGHIAETGEVQAIFANPQSDEAKRLVFSDRSEQGMAVYRPWRKVISVSFNNALATESPLIANLAIEKHIAASILYASTKSVGEKLFGKMLLGIMDEDNNVQETLDYLNGVEGIVAEVENEESLRKTVE